MKSLGRTGGEAAGSPRRARISAQPLMRSVLAKRNLMSKSAYCLAMVRPSLWRAKTSAPATKRWRTVAYCPWPGPGRRTRCRASMDLDGFGVALNDPVSGGMLVRDDDVAVTVGAAEQGD